MKSLHLVGGHEYNRARKTQLPIGTTFLIYLRHVIVPSFMLAVVAASCVIGGGGLSTFDLSDWALHRLYQLALVTGVVTLIISVVWRSWAVRQQEG